MFEKIACLGFDCDCLLALHNSPLISHGLDGIRNEAYFRAAEEFLGLSLMRVYFHGSRTARNIHN